MTEQELEKLKVRHRKYDGFGLSMTVPRWAEALGLPRQSVWRYIKRGLTIEQIFELRGVAPPGYCDEARERGKESAGGGHPNQEVGNFAPGKIYKPVCPRGYDDCVRDPAYIKHHYPEWYANLYGALTPEEAVLTEGGCFERYTKDPDEKYYCYDDEDK